MGPVQKVDQHKANSGAFFKVLFVAARPGEPKEWVWTPISCFLASSWRGPFPSRQAAIDAGKVTHA